MSYAQLLGPLISYLDQHEYGTKIENKDGHLVDTGVQKLVDTLREFVANDNPIEITGPIQYNNTGNGPAFLINNQGESPVGVEMTDVDGRYASFGVGLGSEGIIANNLILLPQYAVDYLVAHCKYSNGGGQGGVTHNTPPDPREEAFQRRTPGMNPGIGLSNVKDCDVGTGYGIEQSGSGFRYDILGGNDTFYVQPPPFGGAGGGGGGGGTGTAAAYGTIASIGDDTITVTLLSGGTVTTAKPFYLRKSEFDGQTISGITYTYAGSQNREATDGTLYEDQAIVPPYIVGNGILVVETPDGNGTGATHMDTNSDARAWAKVSTGCS